MDRLNGCSDTARQHGISLEDAGIDYTEDSMPSPPMDSTVIELAQGIDSMDFNSMEGTGPTRLSTSQFPSDTSYHMLRPMLVKLPEEKPVDESEEWCQMVDTVLHPNCLFHLGTFYPEDFMPQHHLQSTSEEPDEAFFGSRNEASSSAQPSTSQSSSDTSISMVEPIHVGKSKKNAANSAKEDWLSKLDAIIHPNCLYHLGMFYPEKFMPQLRVQSNTEEPGEGVAGSQNEASSSVQHLTLQSIHTNRNDQSRTAQVSSSILVPPSLEQAAPLQPQHEDQSNRSQRPSYRLVFKSDELWDIDYFMQARNSKW